MDTVENTVENTVEQKIDSLTDINRLTIELMMNKSQYKKYLAKTDPNLYQETQTRTENIAKYSNKITDIFMNLLNESNIKYNNKLENIFNAFLNESLEILKNQEYNNTENNTNELFSNNESTTNTTTNTTTNNSSYWGETIQKSSIYTMDKYVERK
jgi:hypothetical protein